MPARPPPPPPCPHHTSSGPTHRALTHHRPRQHLGPQTSSCKGRNPPSPSARTRAHKYIVGLSSHATRTSVLTRPHHARPPTKHASASTCTRICTNARARARRGPHLWPALRQLLGLAVPGAALQEEAADVDPVLGRRRVGGRLGAHHHKVKADRVDRQLVLACIVLQQQQQVQGRQRQGSSTARGVGGLRGRGGVGGPRGTTCARSRVRVRAAAAAAAQATCRGIAPPPPPLSPGAPLW